MRFSPKAVEQRNNSDKKEILQKVDFIILSFVSQLRRSELHLNAIISSWTVELVYKLLKNADKSTVVHC